MAKRNPPTRSARSSADVAPVVERLTRMVLNQLTLIERVQNELVAMPNALDAAQYAGAMVKLQSGLSAMILPWLKASQLSPPDEETEGGALIDVIRSAQADEEQELARLRDEERARIANETLEGGRQAASETVG